ncbi:hypothetical protein HDF22_005562 [Mucilaginibacter lappiensis]|uniref:Uncharacterized protein n=1 Tax=Mucilaginibacter lappiensis TaxID=354630 RepID=A0A841JUA9_9SPHI|nr:hypothetical protein [Mucilaginibacter lappiensis]
MYIHSNFYKSEQNLFTLQVKIEFKELNSKKYVG